MTQESLHECVFFSKNCSLQALASVTPKRREKCFSVFEKLIEELLNNSCPRSRGCRQMADSISWRECSKKFVQQGHSPFDARSVHSVGEHGKRARTPLAAFFNIPIDEIGTVFQTWSGYLQGGAVHALSAVLKSGGMGRGEGNRRSFARV